MKKTISQVKDEIETLIAQAPLVTKRSVFGDDHRSAITAQVRALSESMDCDDVYDAGFNSYDEDAAFAALDWRDGVVSRSPSSEWEPLCDI